jgi:hypothetical protein
VVVVSDDDIACLVFVLSCANVPVAGGDLGIAMQPGRRENGAMHRNDFGKLAVNRRMHWQASAVLGGLRGCNAALAAIGKGKPRDS